MENDIIKAVIKYIMDNLPEIIGIAIASVILVICAFMRDKFLTLISKRFGKLSKTNDNPAQPISNDNSIAHYLSALIKRGSALSFGDPASWSVGGSENEELVTLEHIWTPLRVADSEMRKGKTGTHESMVEEDMGVNLHDLFQGTEQPLLILGEPGSGKSTCLAMFSVEAARAHQKNKDSLLPIWINLSAISIDGNSIGDEKLLLSGVPEINFEKNNSGHIGAELLSDILSVAILKGKALLLLDGLDEIKDHMIDKIRKAISNILQLKNGTRVVVTCRIFDYMQKTPNRKIPIDRELELLPYSLEEQKTYIKRWYDATVRTGRFETNQALELREAVEQEIQNDGIKELAKSPLLLALLLLIHSAEARLPESRAVVCDRAITYMLADSAQWRDRKAGSSTIATPYVLALATEIAHYSHFNENLSTNQVNSGITTELIKTLAKKICETMNVKESSDNVQLIEELSRRFMKSHGLLLSAGNDRFEFSHRSFQEFLAGNYYATGAHHDEALLSGSSTHWREPFKLMASFAGHEGSNLFYILTLIDDLLSSSGENSVTSIMLGAEMATEIGLHRIFLRGFDKTKSEYMWEKATSKMMTYVENPRLSLSERVRSAIILGNLGDKRFESVNNQHKLWDSLIDVSSRESFVGSERLDIEQVKNTGGFVGSRRKLEFVSFKVGRYPVTNAEFASFIRDGGYEVDKYWTCDMGRKWLIGDQDTLDLIREHWMSTVYDHHAKEIRDSEIDTNRLQDEAKKRTEPRSSPYYWFDKRFNGANQPVVGINYWEALAYCEWATKVGHEKGHLNPGYIVTIPTEFEWEHASRKEDDDRIFPWGNDWSEERAHVSTNSLNMRQPVPVGVYCPHWEGGPSDMSGNVWEWTASLRHPYELEYDALRIDDNSLSERIVRGSSWYNSYIVAGCSVRCVDRSYNLFYDVGFRIVVIRRGQKRAGHF